MAQIICFMILGSCQRKTRWDPQLWCGAIPQEPLWPLYTVSISFSLLLIIKTVVFALNKHCFCLVWNGSKSQIYVKLMCFTEHQLWSVITHFVFRTTALAAKLSDFNLGSDKHTFLSKLIKNIFSCYLESYIDMERQYLQNRSGMILQRYYDSKNHQNDL